MVVARCPHGHHWEIPSWPEPPANATRAVCPVCGAKNITTADSSTPPLPWSGAASATSLPLPEGDSITSPIHEARDGTPDLPSEATGCGSMAPADEDSDTTLISPPFPRSAPPGSTPSGSTLTDN